MGNRAKRCSVATTASTCGARATHFVFVDFRDYAVPYHVCLEHHQAAERGEGMTFRLRGLLLGWKPGLIATTTDKPVRKDLL